MSIVVNGTTLSGVNYNGVDLNKVYARNSINDDFILVFSKGGTILRIKISCGNWKMNPATLDADNTLAAELKTELDKLSDLGDGAVIICPPTGFLYPVMQTTGTNANIKFGCQRIASTASVAGSYTGQMSAAQIKSMGVDYAFVGNSECREYLGDTNADCAIMITAALNAGMKAIYFVGEPLEVRNAETWQEYIATQLQEGLANVPWSGNVGNMIIAYEPIWAIGTGKVITPDQAQEVMEYIRQWLSTNLSAEAANTISLCFGGSVNPANVAAIIAQVDIDGAVVGGGATNAERFAAVTDVILKG